MTANAKQVNGRFRIVWAIAAKDIVDALKNRTIATVMMGLALLMLTSQALPLLLKLNPIPRAVVYDPGGSALVDLLAESKEFSVRRMPTRQEAEQWVAESSEVVLGLVLPGDLDARLESGEATALEAFTVHWAAPSKVSELMQFFQIQFSQAAGQTINVEASTKTVYPQPDAGGRPYMVSMAFVIATVMVGAFLVPYLMIEEREMHTMDSLLVSPASYAQVVMGKALAGTFYCLAALAVLFAFNVAMINLWGLALLAAACGALFTVAVGLLMGTLFDNAANLNLWLGVILMVLLVPVFLAETLGSNFPEIIKNVVPWIPSVALAEIFRTSFSNDLSVATTLPDLTVLLAFSLFFLALTVWRVRQMDK